MSSSLKSPNSLRTHDARIENVRIAGDGIDRRINAALHDLPDEVELFAVSRSRKDADVGAGREQAIDKSIVGSNPSRGLNPQFTLCDGRQRLLFPYFITSLLLYFILFRQPEARKTQT
jgi:hypothetical protein